MERTIWKKARKKPIVIEYREITGYGAEVIQTREGILLGYPDKDFIIRGIEGEIYPIKKEIFYKTYEVIEDGE